MSQRSAGVGVLLVMAMAAAFAQQAPNGARATQRRLGEVREAIREVRADRSQTESERAATTRALTEANAQLQQASQRVARSDAQWQAQRAQLAALELQRATLEGSLAGQRQTLAELARASYRSGGDAPLKVLLSQDRFAAGQRALAAYGYLQRARAGRIRALRVELAGLAATRTSIDIKRTQLAAARARQQADVAALAAAKRKHADALRTLDARHAQQQAREAQLGADARQLEGVLAQLRAAAKRAERERESAAARERQATAAEAKRQATERERRARAQAQAVAQAKARGLPPPAAPTEVDEPAPPAPRTATPAATASAAPRVGGIGWPVSGSLLAGFGGSLPQGGRSSGLLIAAPAGTAVHAVAAGKVVFADYMNGYGLICIIDHGGGLLSLYAHNDSLLRDVGSTVARGDAVASVGRSGGVPQPALYFELRRNGAPVNPSGWFGNR